METIIIVGLLVLIGVIWIVSSRRRLVVLEENVNNAMSQIGVQVSSRFDALISLAELTRSYAFQEIQPLVETLKTPRSTITAASTPEDVLKQEHIITESLNRITAIAEWNPDLKANQDYVKCLNAVESYGKMVCTSRLIYNDSVTKLNRALRIFPTSVAGGLLGFRQRTYLVAAEKRLKI